MKNAFASTPSRSVVVALIFVLGLASVTSSGQDRLKTMPGYDQYQKISKEIPGSVKMGALAVKWKDGGKAFEYQKDGKTYLYTIATRTASEVGQATGDSAADSGRAGGRRRAGGP